MIIDRYVTIEVLKPLVTIMVILITIFAGYSSGRYLSYAVDGLLQIETLASFIFIKLLIALEVLVPIALYISIVLGLGRMEARSEITALRSCGMSNLRILRIVLGIAFLLALLVAVFSIYGRPLAYQKSYIIKAQAEAELELDKLASGNFYDSENRARTIFVDEVDKARGLLHRVFIRGERSGIIHIISARSGEHHVNIESGRRTLLLHDVHVYFLGPRGERDRIIGRFKQMNLKLGDIAPPVVGYKRKAAPITELAMSTNSLDIAEFQWRLSTPVSTLLLAVLAVILTRAAPRSSRYAKTIGALLLYAIYFNLAALARTWVETGDVSPIPGIWWVHGLLLGLILLAWWWPRWRFNRAARLAPRLVDAS